MRNLCLLIMITMLSLTSCGESPQKAFEKAESEGTIQSYKLFVKKFSNTEFTQQATKKLWSLEYQKAQDTNTVAGFEYFMHEYPESDNYQDAQRMAWNLQYSEAKQENTKESYEKFIANCPNAPQLKDATNRLKILNLIGSQVTWIEETYWQDSSGGWMVNLASGGGLKRHFNVQNYGIIKEVYDTDVLVEIQTASIPNRKRSISGVEQNYYDSAINQRVGKTVRVPKFKLNID